MNSNTPNQGPQLPQMQQRTTPFSELDLTFLTTEPEWGKNAAGDLYKATAKAVREAHYQDLNGEKVLVIDKQPLWGLLQYYTRDLRLGNLSAFPGGELAYCQTWLDIAGDLLKCEHPESFLAALSRVITVVELSQSKNGFFRRRGGTITSEHIGEKPSDKKLTGGKKEA